ncbi:MAG: Eco57I restriction-modification methylase domain-containing protein [Acidimicrobiia bacterium]|nr:Eco57I restriction-modification methylase domain-containing protein [Acidimicrobiia bacterium]
MTTELNPPSTDLSLRVEARRVRESACREATQRGELGQFFTPAAIARVLAGMFDVPPPGALRVLDPGAGVGSLTAALVDRARDEGWPVTLDLTAVEVDGGLMRALEATLIECEDLPLARSATLHSADFITWGCEQLRGGLFAAEPELFDLVILNPPYRKLNTDSADRRRLSSIGIEVTNLYAAFVALAARMLAPGGQLVAITPRSFCNGPYFKAFRKELLASTALRRIHVFDSRDEAFRDTAVLQENVIFHLVKEVEQGSVVIESSSGGGSGLTHQRVVPFERVVHPGDANTIIHLVPDEAHADVAGRMGALPCELPTLGVAVSTGRVVDFRVREHLRMEAGPGMVPLLYPTHMRAGRVRWPVPGGKKANALADAHETQKLLLPAGNYVLVKRFSSKEERRRIVASVLEKGDLPGARVAVEHHVNVFHNLNAGLPLEVAWGIAAYLNSTIVDLFFRQFNGHTQVNATDLRSLRYPSVDQLVELGTAAREAEHDQNTIDLLVERFVPSLTDA